MNSYDEFFKKAGNYNSNTGVSYYEDTHDSSGNYVGEQNRTENLFPRREPIRDLPRDSYSSTTTASPSGFNGANGFASPSAGSFASPSNNFMTGSATGSPVVAPTQTSTFTNIAGVPHLVVHEPKTPEDLQKFIDHLKTNQHAVLRLNHLPPSYAQRMLDFVSGAIYALNGSINSIAENIFLLTPPGVNVSIPK